MNPWLEFIKSFYAAERRRDPTNCRDSGSLKRVAKVYKCHKKLSMRKKSTKETFRMSNPMHNKTVKRKK